jgi:CHAT domain-containing protein
MNAEEFVERLLSHPDIAAQRGFLEEHQFFLDNEVVLILKEKADHFLRANVHRSFEIAELLYYIAELTYNSLFRANALGLLVEANARSIGLGQYERAITLYDEAAEIYRLNGCIAEQARSQVGKVNALSYLGRFAEALEIGQGTLPILEAHGQWLPLLTMIMNLGIMHGRQGKDVESLVMFDRAGELYEQLGADGKTGWGLIQQNRAIALRNLGRFDDSIKASQLSREILNQLGENVEAARAQQGLAVTYLVLGRFNEALKMLDRARNIFLEDGRMPDTMSVELYTTDCLLELRRFSEVIEKCRYIRGLFAEIGTRQVEALAIINEAVAYTELHRYDEALASLSDARRIFEQAGNDVRAATTDLERSAVFLCLNQYSTGLALAQDCVTVFETYHLPIEKAQALIVAARAALALKQYQQADEFLKEALQVGETLNIPTVRYQAHSLLGTLAHVQGDIEEAKMQFDWAIQEVEQLRGRLMVEFRVGFLEDKEALYQNMVELCIEQGQLLQGLEFVERAKSRALLDLLAYRLDLTIQARDTEDIPLVEELTRLRAARNQLYRRWESYTESGEKNERGWSSAQSQLQKSQQDMLVVEKQITDLWHRLLIHNAGYARDAALWTVHTESAQPHLKKDTLLVEYYEVHEKLIVFLLTANDIQVIELAADVIQIQDLIERFRLNLRAVSKRPTGHLAALTSNAQALLLRLYHLVFAPLENHLSGYSKLMIVPHGPLHYLPFHALYDGNCYLLERYEISYLPNASSLRYCQEARPSTSRSLSLGYSNGGRLPHAVKEAQLIAALLDCPASDEERATLAEFYRMAPECRTIHLATHGDFRADNPLFSGLILADGWLTTMDIFNLHLKASLVTLSACQTGRNVISGGDELLGLMRAFLSAGAASVGLTLWAVEDHSTARLMESFYRKMTEGHSKGDALRNAQLQFLRQPSEFWDKQSEYYAHPYFWAPFFLVGDAGPL